MDIKNFFEWFKREDSSAEQKFGAKSPTLLKAPNRRSLELVEEYTIGENHYQIFRIHDDKYIYQDIGAVYYLNGEFFCMANDIKFAPIGGDRPPLIKVLIKDHTPEWNYFQGLFTLDGVFVAPIYHTRYYDTTSDLAWEHFRITVCFDMDVLSFLEKAHKEPCAVIDGSLVNVPVLMTNFFENAPKMLPMQVSETTARAFRRLSTLDFYESNWSAPTTARPLAGIIRSSVNSTTMFLLEFIVSLRFLFMAGTLLLK